MADAEETQMKLIPAFQNPVDAQSLWQEEIAKNPPSPPRRCARNTLGGRSRSWVIWRSRSRRIYGDDPRTWQNRAHRHGFRSILRHGQKPKD